MPNKIIAIGIYQNKNVAIEVLSILKNSGFKKSALIHDGVIEQSSLDHELISKYSRYITKDETLIIVKINVFESFNALTILRKFESQNVVTFLFGSCTLNLIDKEAKLPSHPFSPDELTQATITLSKELKKEPLIINKNTSLLTELKKSEQILKELHQVLFDADKMGQTKTISVQWVLDNFYLIRGHIRDIFSNLPKRYYRELPKVTNGNENPKIYILAAKLIEMQDGKLDTQNIKEFLKNYQNIDYLTIGELWAFPLFIRLGIIEALRNLVLMATLRQCEGEVASFFGNRLLNFFHKDKDSLPSVFKNLQDQFPKPSSHFAEELLDHLFDEESLLDLVKQWLEISFKSNISDLLLKDQVQEAAEQVSMANCITSLIFLTQMDFRKIFKEVSKVEAILNQDPVKVFQDLSFKTSDLYLHAVEKMAKRSNATELEVTTQALNLALKGENSLKQHVGYYLIDEGRDKLEEKIQYAPAFLDHIRSTIMKHPQLTYLGSLLIMTCFLMILLIFLTMEHVPSNFLAVFVILGVLPVSELVIQVQNILFTLFLRPFILPKLEFKNGIPKEYKTLVVIPSMLINQESIQSDLRDLEIRYLANRDPELKFSLFTDFVDSKFEGSKEDDLLAQYAVDGILALNEKYEEGTFFLFHRKRRWSDTENAYIGQERKRGKLEVLNRFLLSKLESSHENILYAGNFEDLRNIRYIITLDRDTELPKNRALKLIETIAHPLNEAVLDINTKKVLRGYTLIQPRVTTSLPSSNKTYFSKIFSGAIGSDPYTEAVSDIYHDMLHEGSYLGKGIYDLSMFDRVLDKRFPSNHILSHDLIEGAYVRTGYASGIELLDNFPEDYELYSKREHRWIRGDWQITDWLMPSVPTSAPTKEKNPLSYMNRWKIFDNLRRSLLPVSLLSMIILTGLILNNYLIWVTFAWVVLFISSFAMTLFRIFAPKLELTMPSEQIKNSVLKNIMMASVLPYEAFLSLDAIVRVIYRRLISKKHLLQWSINNKKGVRNRFSLKLISVSVFALFFGVLIYFFNPSAFFGLSPFIILWMLSPLIVYMTGKETYKQPSIGITPDDHLFLRGIGRKTWAFFDDFVNEESNHLPPDNFQESYGQGVAFRTSPTNIGLWLLSLYSAYDFGYISARKAFFKTTQTVQSLLKLELYQGHLFNWYDIKTLKPLLPKYVSTVDSGNLLACLWTLEQTISDVFFDEILKLKTLNGLKDTLDAIKLETVSPDSDIKLIFDQLNQLFSEKFCNLSSKILVLEKASELSKTLNDLVNNETFSKKLKDYVRKLESEINDWNESVQLFFPWVKVLQKMNAPHIQSYIKAIDEESFSFFSLSEKDSQGILAFLEILKQDKSIEGSEEFINTYSESKKAAKKQMDEMKETLASIHRLSEEMNMRFLYNETRKVFTIGYNVSDNRLDNSYYDLLASEARLSSFVSIAKNDAPVEHWFALGRSFSLVEGQKVLLSWGGTMFEYLMPMLLTKSYKKSLLDEACLATVACQIVYGNRRGIPWGISESAYSALDARKTYQYQSFGVPKLGLKRGLDDELVVSPYSTGLSLMVDSQSSILNLKRLKHAMHSDIFGDYGYYESIDYTRQHGPHGERGIVIHAYMAHHQGMMFISINNLLHDGIMQNRFHNDPRIRAVESLLYERLPSYSSITKDYTKQAPVARLRALHPYLNISKIETADTPNPKVNLLSNGNYSVMMTNSGTGYSHFDQLELTRWSADPTSSELGSFCYIKDLETGNYWSSTYQPTNIYPTSYSVNFTSDKIEFKRRDFDIETLTEIVVSPEDHAEVRRMTFTNFSKLKKHLEVTSYLEISLSPHSNDLAHKAFNKMFIQTEVSQLPFGLIATRRKRSEAESPIFMAHLVTSKDFNDNIFQYETDRRHFIGRGRTLQNPKCLDQVLSNTTGAVLDPIFSLRKQVVVEPHQRIEISFVTLFATSLEAIHLLINKYTDFKTTSRAIEMSWTYSELQLRHLRISQEEAKVFQKLAGKIIYPQKNLRATPERLKKNKLGQSDLWAYGISGDNPIITITIGDAEDLNLVREILVAHAFLNLRGLKCDVVFLNAEQNSYDQPLKSQILKLIQSFSYQTPMEKGAQVFLLSIDQMPEDHLNLFLTVSRAVLVSARGVLKDQLIHDMLTLRETLKLQLKQGEKECLSEELPFMELDFFNGLGGFTKDGSEYIIYLKAGESTPQPWINVIANEKFGVTVSESGIGSCWFGNSQANRLTPWSNDPLLDPICDLIYLRDDELGVYWSSTPSPIRELDPYRIRHGQGYSVFEHNSHGINQELTIFVPVDEQGGSPVRIQRLKLKNASNKKRKLTLMAYSQIVLGSNSEDSRLFIVTEMDSLSKTLIAKNTYNPNYGSQVTFASCSPKPNYYTTDRLEFIGRNQTAKTPLALTKVNLSNTVGAALDPCMALQITIEMQPGETYESIFLLGQAPDMNEALRLVNLYQDYAEVERAFQNSKKWWSNFLKTVEVETPDVATNYLLNHWLLYQNLSCRIWGRTAFYQSSGAYGFRDQLQDVMALLYSTPKISREQILLSAAHQFLEGDVQHWWHPKSNGGIRTRISDDLLWLPFVTAQYLRVTNDISILQEEIPFLKGPMLEQHEHEIYFIPEITEEKFTLIEHCRRAIIKGTTKGPHGLPLIGTGDWNDGMNRIGIEGKGESVWLGFFLVHALNDFVEILEKANGNIEEINAYKQEVTQVLNAIENNAWDGEWYLRAFYDDGTPVGSINSEETKIDSLPQSWSVITGSGSMERSRVAMESVKKHLVNEQERLVLILREPFDKTLKDPGYIKGYPPGIRENGGQYTHGSLWVPLAFARLKKGQEAVEILQLMNPIKRTLSEEGVLKYAVEPYILAADIYYNPSHLARGGWTWYTGSAAWMYRIWLEEILGFKLRGNKLHVEPVLPDDWKSFKINYRYLGSVYKIVFEVRDSYKQADLKYYLDDQLLASQEIHMQDDGKEHNVRISNF